MMTIFLFAVGIAAIYNLGYYMGKKTKEPEPRRQLSGPETSMLVPCSTDWAGNHPVLEQHDSVVHLPVKLGINMETRQAMFETFVDGKSVRQLFVSRKELLVKLETIMASLEGTLSDIDKEKIASEDAKYEPGLMARIETTRPSRTHDDLVREVKFQARQEQFQKKLSNSDTGSASTVPDIREFLEEP